MTFVVADNAHRRRITRERPMLLPLRQLTGLARALRSLLSLLSFDCCWILGKPLGSPPCYRFQYSIQYRTPLDRPFNMPRGKLLTAFWLRHLSSLLL